MSTPELKRAPRSGCVVYLVGVEGVEYGLDVEGLLRRAALHAEDPLELVEVQGAAGTLPHEHNAQLLNLGQIHLLGVALLLPHGLWMESCCCCWFNWRLAQSVGKPSGHGLQPNWKEPVEPEASI